MMLAIICNIYFMHLSYGTKDAYALKTKIYINLFCGSKLLTEVDPKKDEVSSYKQA